MTGAHHHERDHLAVDDRFVGQLGQALHDGRVSDARFIDPMLLLRTDSLPNDGDRWEYQLKFDGYRAIAFKTGGKVHLRSRNDNDFSIRYAAVMKGLAKLPDETVIDGEVIALDLW
jgi:bifunctional non-homologous end joining protein LigD